MVNGSSKNTVFHTNCTSTGGTYPFITIPDLDGRVLIDDTSRTLSDKGASALSSSLLPPGSVLVSCIATIGKCGVTTRPSFTNQQINSVIPESGVDPLFLYYVFTQIGHKLEAAGGGGSIYTNVSKGRFSDIEVLIPVNLAEQRAIAHILGTLDDKIQLNRRMNQTLEAISRTIFKDWFVDFGPVRAKMEGRDPYLPSEIWELFPDRFVDSEFGDIPKGWEVKKLKECINLTMGQSPPGSTYNDRKDGLPFFQGSSEFDFRYAKKRRYCSSPTRLAMPEDTLVSVRAPVGDINMAWERCCIGRGLASLRHKSGSGSFTYYFTWALQSRLREYKYDGTVFGAINKNQFENLVVVEPDSRIVAEFDSIAANMDRRIRVNVSESHKLTASRDVLLPKLISGDLRVDTLAKLFKNIHEKD